jgi:hypothetical protein
LDVDRADVADTVNVAPFEAVAGNDDAKKSADSLAGRTEEWRRSTD